MLNYCGDCLQKKPLYHANTILILFAFLLLGVVVNEASAQIMDSPAEIAQQKLTQQIKNAKPQPYEISSRIHLEQGTQAGYLVVEIKIAKGQHIYSLTQAGVVPPSILKVLPNSQIQLTGNFSPDTPAAVIENDPIFHQRLEKHTGKVQFFAPISIDPAADLTKLAAEVQFDGQICSEEACLPIRAKMITGKFAGYFDNKPTPNSVAKQPVSQQPASGSQLK